MNLVARSYGETHLKKGDRILIPVSEHHSNLVPWQRAAKKTGAVLEYMYVDKETGRLPEGELKKIDDPRVKILAFAQVSNVLGLAIDAKALISRAHKHGAVVVLDGAQSTPHKRWMCRSSAVISSRFPGIRCALWAVSAFFTAEKNC